MKKTHLFSLGLAGSLLLATSALAEMPNTTIKVVGQPIQNIFHTQGEIPFFKETIVQMSKGKVKAELVSQEQVGISGGEVMRLLSKGSIDFGSGGLTQAVADSPKFEGCDLPGLTDTLQEAKAGCEAYRPVVSAMLEKNFGVKLLALAYNPPQAIWCAKPISGLEDLKGKKVRVYNQSLTDFVTGAGGTALNIPYADTVPALKSGVIDCAITGTLTGNTSKWFEVTSHLYPMSLGWAVQFWGVNLKTWNRYPKDVQEFLEVAFKKLEERLAELSAMAVAQGLDCNQNKDTCTIGVKAKMTIVPVDDAARSRRVEIMESSVLPRWAGRCGKDCAIEWNNVMSPVVKLQVSTN